MKLLHNLFQRQIVRPYSSNKQVNLDFMIETLKCHRDDKHDVKGLDSEAEVPPFVCSFNNSLLQGHMLAVADEEGGVCLYDVRKQGTSAKLKGWVAHSNAIFDIAWVNKEPKIVTASGDQTAQLWDIQQSTRLAVFKGHSCSLKSVDFQDENLFVFATAARDGNVMVWDIRCNKRDGYYKPVNTIHNCHSTLSTTGTPQRNKRRGRRLSSVAKPDSQQSVTAVTFQDVNTIISAGAVDGNIKVWDLRRNYSTICTEPLPYHVFPYPGAGTRKHGYSSLTFDSTKSKLFANCTNDVIYMYDCITYQNSPLATFSGHTNATFYIKSCVSPDDQYLISGSGDSDGYIWRIDNPTAAPYHLTGHSNEVTCVAWCPRDQTKVITCSDDNSLNVWRVNYTEKNNGDFVGWCEKKPNALVPIEEKDNTSNNTKTPQTPPTRTRSDSTTSSPASLSPNAIKYSSPQQFLQKWLELSDKNGKDGIKTHSSVVNTNSDSSVCNKRPREIENIENKNKRVCLGENNNNDIKEDKNSDKDLFQFGGSLKNEASTSNIANSSKDANKENVNTNLSTSVKLEQFSNKKKSEEELSECNIQSSQSDCSNVLAKNDTDQSQCRNALTNQNGKKSNWLRDMGVKKKNLNKVSRKVRHTSQPNSPVLQEPSSPNADLGVVLKNMKSIKDYFAPLSYAQESKNNYCLR